MSTFVLVPGAWHGEWSFRPVAEHLRAAGHAALGITLPGLSDGDDPAGHSMSEAVTAIVDLVESRDLRDITLVAHSWGSYPMTGAAHRLGASRVAALVYVNAVVPRPGMSLYDEFPVEYQELLTALSSQSDDGGARLPFEVWQGLLDDAPELVQRAYFPLLVPQPFQYLVEPVDAPAVVDLPMPAAFVFSNGDSGPSFENGGLDDQVARTGGRLVEISGSHEGLLTRPDEVAQAIIEAGGPA
ncbi:alpha/beta hydrolase [Rhodococcus fascians]|nr:alpha/beta hydrolase [Rhodococcus fascians]MBY3995182.1 alpha/beta hydrolase [Rhodococcus fascians]MBY4000498.1 alpha/beta hydrolase [Rhodococcus fascians]MBY4005526.1 alpha/beta hydrolase [Rhodococcus fascians]MBY4016359.1 alpha/beta hydrolase [Rhodococcus fascians]